MLFENKKNVYEDSVSVSTLRLLLQSDISSQKIDITGYIHFSLEILSARNRVFNYSVSCIASYISSEADTM